MKSITSLLAVLAIGSTLALADDKPAAPAGGDTKPAAPTAPAAGDAGKPKHDPAEVFKKLDTNGDGKISLEEFLAGPAGKKDQEKAKETFKKKDKDGDGFLSLEEFSAHGEKKAK
jgi:hypothetical protein